MDDSGHRDGGGGVGFGDAAGLRHHGGARLFPNEASLLRLISALASEISEDWEAGKLYLDMTMPHPPTRLTPKQFTETNLHNLAMHNFS